jgi:hypothetical protein
VLEWDYTSLDCSTLLESVGVLLRDVYDATLIRKTSESESVTTTDDASVYGLDNLLCVLTATSLEAVSGGVRLSDLTELKVTTVRDGPPWDFAVFLSGFPTIRCLIGYESLNDNALNERGAIVLDVDEGQATTLFAECECGCGEEDLLICARHVTESALREHGANLDERPLLVIGFLVLLLLLVPGDELAFEEGGAVIREDNSETCLNVTVRAGESVDGAPIARSGRRSGSVNHSEDCVCCDGIRIVGQLDKSKSGGLNSVGRDRVHCYMCCKTEKDSI